MISINKHFFFHSFILLVGLFGLVINRSELIRLIIAIEVILLSINLNLLMCSIYLDDVMGQIFAILVLTVAAGESAIGLALIITFFRLRGAISIKLLTNLSL